MDKNKRGQKGFSLIELLMVLGIVVVLTGVSLFYLAGHQKLYRAEEQALQLVDILQDARQKSLTQRETMRVEIDLTSKVVRLVEENVQIDPADDRVVKEANFYSSEDVRIDTIPRNINTTPPEPSPVPVARYLPSVYQTSQSHDVCIIRFQRNGTVVDAGTDDVGSSASLAGLTLYIWKPKKDSTNEADIARAITIMGGTGSIRMWEFLEVSGEDRWRDSRRSGYGQAGTTVSQ